MKNSWFGIRFSNQVGDFVFFWVKIWGLVCVFFLLGAFARLNRVRYALLQWFFFLSNCSTISFPSWFPFDAWTIHLQTWVTNYPPEPSIFRGYVSFREGTLLVHSKPQKWDKDETCRRALEKLQLQEAKVLWKKISSGCHFFSNLSFCLITSLITLSPITSPKTNMDTQNDGPWKRWNPLKYGHFWYQFVRFLGCSKFVKTIGSVQFSIQGSTPTIQGSTAIPQQRSKPLATKKHVCEESVTIWDCLVSCVFLQKNTMQTHASP